jgi:hypothetical protein
MSPTITAEESTTTGPCTSMSPLTAPAMTAEVATILPTITVPCPILTEPLASISPSICALLANTSLALELPVMLPLTVSFLLEDSRRLQVTV